MVAITLEGSIKYIQKQSYRQPPILNALYISEEQIHTCIMQAPQLTPDAKVKLYDHTLQRFLTFQNQLQNQQNQVHNLIFKFSF